MQVMILKCLDDEDVTIKHRALDLVSGMISKKNLVDIVRILMEHVTTAEVGPPLILAQDTTNTTY